MKNQPKHLLEITKPAIPDRRHQKHKRAKRTLTTGIIGSVLTVTLVLASTTHFADKAGLVLKYSHEVSDALIAEYVDEVFQKANEKLQRYGNWRAEPTIRTEHQGGIAAALLAIAGAKQAKGYSTKKVLKDYYDITKQFPDSPQAITALCKIAILDEENGPKYAEKFLREDTAEIKVIQFYDTIIKHYMTKLDYVNVRKYVKLFIDKFILTKDGLKLMGRLISEIGQIENYEKLDKFFIQQAVSQNPNSRICCAVFRYRALELFGKKNFGRLEELTQWICAEFPETKLATCAVAVQADSEYQQGNFVFALEKFKPGLFAEQRPETAIIEDIEGTLTLYNANTLQPQGIDLGKVYETLAKYTHGLGHKAIAKHCYRQIAKAKSISQYQPVIKSEQELTETNNH